MRQIIRGPRLVPKKVNEEEPKLRNGYPFNRIVLCNTRKFKQIFEFLKYGPIEYPGDNCATTNCELQRWAVQCRYFDTETF